MKEKPILFSTEMVRAILDGRKTQTRRIVKIKNGKWHISKESNDQNRTDVDAFGVLDENKNLVEIEDGLPGTLKELGFCKYSVGDLLWVKETYAFAPLEKESKESYPELSDFIYKANGSFINIKWKPSMFMPKSVARIWLEITNIRIERLQEISEEDAEKEGIELIQYDCYQNYMNGIDWIYEGRNQNSMGMLRDPIGSFASLWTKINGIGSYDSNPFVWVIEFKRIERKS